MKITEDLIKSGSINRPGSKNSCKYITLHDTGNKTVGSSAASHARYIKTLREKTSWHYTVDDKEIYRHIPDNEKTYHTSDKFANENSISIELCVNADGDFAKTLLNATELVAVLVKKYSIPKENIRRHHDWTGKNCPASLMNDGWEDFVERCTSSAKTEKTISISALREMGYTAITLD